MAYELSEAFYAGLSTLPLDDVTDQETFTNLFEDALGAFRGGKVYGSNSASTRGDELKRGFNRSINSTGDVALHSDLAAGISAVRATRAATGLGIPEAAYLTGNSWHRDIAMFKVPAAGMSDYNSSDIVLRYPNNHFVGISLKKKKAMQDASPPLTNAAFSSFLQNDAVSQLLEEIEEVRYKFFAKIIWDACHQTGRNSPFWSEKEKKLLLECGAQGKPQKIYEPTGELTKTGKPKTEKIEYRLPDIKLQPNGELSLQDAKRVLKMKVDVWRWSAKDNDWKREEVPLINLKDIDHVRNINPRLPRKDNIQTRWRNYVNGQLKGSSTLWTDFVNIMNKDDEITVGGQRKKFKDYMADTLLTRALKLDLKKVLKDAGITPTFDFYLVEGVGKATNKPLFYKADADLNPIENETTTDSSFAAREGGKKSGKLLRTGQFVMEPSIGTASVVKAETLLEKINEWCGTGCTNEVRLEKGSADAASAEFGLYMTSSSGVTIKALNITLRYGGSFVAHPRFHATMTGDFKKQFKTN